MHHHQMRRSLITVAVLLAVFDAVWLLTRPGPQEPEYYVESSLEDWFFEDGDLHKEDPSKLPVWDGKRWMLNGKHLPNISSEVGKRPLLNDERCVFEYRLKEDITYADFLSAQMQAEDAGSAIMILTSSIDKKWVPSAQDFDWFLFHSVRKNVRCRDTLTKSATK